MRKGFLLVVPVAIVGAVVAAQLLKVPDLVHIGDGHNKKKTFAHDQNLNRWWSHDI